jgi:hypothetical protein
LFSCLQLYWILLSPLSFPSLCTNEICCSSFGNFLIRLCFSPSH